jgi:hypothetical protein
MRCFNESNNFDTLLSMLFLWHALMHHGFFCGFLNLNSKVRDATRPGICCCISQYYTVAGVLPAMCMAAGPSLSAFLSWTQALGFLVSAKSSYLSHLIYGVRTITTKSIHHPRPSENLLHAQQIALTVASNVRVDIAACSLLQRCLVIAVSGCFARTSFQIYT